MGRFSAFLQVIERANVPVMFGRSPACKSPPGQRGFQDEGPDLEGNSCRPAFFDNIRKDKDLTREKGNASTPRFASTLRCLR